MFYEHMKAVCKKKHTSPSKSNVTNWKNGGWPRLDVVMEMAKVLNVPPARLIPKEDK